MKEGKGVLKNPKRIFSSPLENGQTVYDVDPISLGKVELEVSVAMRNILTTFRLISGGGKKFSMSLQRKFITGPWNSSIFTQIAH